MTREELAKLVGKGYLTWEQIAVALMNILGDETLHDAMLSHWGKRCPDYEAECPACSAWKNYDEFVRKSKHKPEKSNEVWMQWVDANSYGMKKLGGNK